MKLATSLFAALVLVAATASADSSPKPGTKGTVTAFEPDGTTVIAVRACPSPRAGTFSYTACGPLLRTDARALLCKRGKGRHDWKYQIGDGPLLAQVTQCR